MTAPSENELPDLFFEVSKRMRRNQAAHLAPLGLTPAQARALRVIARADEPMRMVDLAARLDVVPRTVTTLADALEAAGLVRRVADPANRRSTLLEPTDAGRAARDRLSEARRLAAAEVFAPLSPAQRETLRALLTELREPVADPVP
ncbi:MarR family winged helix-turn-helix transcriptional regulator [Nocardia sp. alder85J]|uniref:MarR family winged helix-turn-helix transcriptional regulator n=1 Tax=Nocardia sp. alder85J TaxID=2862949 RepID=UPI001CD5AAB8|nr:MarR family transcriptional regulator [Nocardia sp. alder85J]MCX4093885.1 MarR family transcriptional regulator [Nocardia sp. alder85J]